MTGRILAVTAALVSRGPEILLAQRLPAATNGLLWELPGGKIEFGESPEQSLAREMREELGMDIAVGEIHGVFTHVHSPDLQILLLVYRCQPGRMTPQALECQDFRWLSPRDALALALAPLDQEIVSQLVGGQL